MPKVTFFKPVDPPQGVNRMIDELKNCLQSTDYKTFYFAVAFAKVGPLLRLVADFENWRNSRKAIHAIYGIDLKGTSIQALDFSQTLFNQVYITHNPIFTTFHPKIYLFKGTSKARAYIGSQNFTVGGMELNFEGGVRIDMDLPAEEDVWKEAFESWECLLPANCRNTKKLTKILFKQLIKRDYLIDEMATKASVKGAAKPKDGAALPKLFPVSPPAPQSSIKLPKKYKKKKKTFKKPSKPPLMLPLTLPLPSRVTSAYQALAIQIIPHHNGEIFLSKGALDQSHAFFGYPFTGRTTSKKASNPPYEMREPDPSVTLTLYDNTGAVVHHEVIPNLNMVYYIRKSDIRITINPTLAATIPEYSILIMALTPPTSPLDYELHVYFPGSSIYNSYLAQCNQALPSGGKPVPRRMGWL